MPALLEQLIDGPGFVLLPNLIDAVRGGAGALANIGSRRFAVWLRVRQTQ